MSLSLAGTVLQDLPGVDVQDLSSSGCRSNGSRALYEECKSVSDCVNLGSGAGRSKFSELPDEWDGSMVSFEELVLRVEKRFSINW